MKNIFLVAFLTFFTFLTFPSFGQVLDQDPKLIKGTLPNGLTYYIRENSRPEKKVELRLVVKVGSIVEDDDQLGLAHMAEHMAFNGTKNFKKNEIVSFLQDIGVGYGNDLNAYTSFDETVYILPIPIDKPGNLEKGFQVLEDWAHLVTYLDEDINAERAIILEESRLGKSGEERMFKKVYPEMFKGSRYAERLPIGVDSIIRNFQPDAIRRFYRDWYRPDLMAVVVVGDIKKEEALEMINRHFAGLANPAEPRKRDYADVPPYQSPTSVVATDKEAISYSFGLMFPAYKVKPTETVEEYRQDLVQNLYESMLNARFRELTQKENPPFVYAGASFGSYARLHESFMVQAATGTNDIRKGIDAVAEEIERIKRFGFTQSELERAGKNLLAFYERAWNNREKTESAMYADEYVANFTTDEPVPGIDREYELAKQFIPGIELDEVNRLTDRFRNEPNYFTYVMGPDNSAVMTAPTGPEVLEAVAAKAKSPEITPYSEAAVATSLLTTEPKPGKVEARAINPTLGTTTYKLSNGVLVTFRPTDFKDDQILMAAYRFGGINKYGVNDKYDAENAVNAVTSMGIGKLTPTDIRKVTAGKTASLSPYLTGTTEGFRGSSSNKDIETMLQLLYLYVMEPRADSSLYRSFIQRSKAQFAMMGANPQIAFIDTVFSTLYNGNPLAPTAIPKSEHYDRISMSRSLEIYKDHLGDVSGMQFYFVGSMNVEEIIPLIEKYIGSLPASGKVTNYVDNKVRPARGDKDLVFRKGKEDRSLILTLISGEAPFSHDLGFRLQALSDIMNIKIFEEMREKIQGIYTGSTGASLTKIPYSNYDFMLRLPCGPDKTDTLLEAFNTEMYNIAIKGPDTATLQKVKIQWLEEYRVNIKTNEYWLSKLQQFAQGESAPERMLNFERYVNALQPADIRTAARMIMAAPSKLTAILKPE